MYIELHSRSAFSFLEGASLPEELISTCAQFGMPAMALLDTDGVYGAPRFHLAATKIGLKAHIGTEVTCQFPISDCRLRIEKHNSGVNQSTIKNRKSTISPTIGNRKLQI